MGLSVCHNTGQYRYSFFNSSGIHLLAQVHVVGKDVQAHTHYPSGCISWITKGYSSFNGPGVIVILIVVQETYSLPLGVAQRERVSELFHMCL